MSDFVMLVGLPASGKTTYANHLKEKGYKVYSSDAIREELFGDESVQDNPDRVFKALRSRVYKSLENNEDCVYDATNMSEKRRRDFLTSLNRYSCKKICVLFATQFSVCKKRNRERDRFVPEDVINNMRSSFNMPHYYEGWDEIRIVWNFSMDYELYTSKIKYMDVFDQRNPHHTRTLGGHMRKAENLAVKKCAQGLDKDCSLKGRALARAVYYHDIGKQYCGTFVNKKTGKLDKECHYYGHEHISAYEAMFMMKFEGYNDEEIIEACTIICKHMIPHSYHYDYMNLMKKKVPLWGMPLFESVMFVHSCDLGAL